MLLLNGKLLDFELVWVTNLNTSYITVKQVSIKEGLIQIKFKYIICYC